MIPYGRQSISEQDIAAVENVLRSDFLTQGPAVPHFEQRVAAYCGASHALAVNSATSALHMACLAAGLGPGDWLWTSPITFVASSNCGLYCGASVDFVDIDPHTLNLSPTALAEKLEKAASEGRLPKVVIPVHFSGEPCDMEAIAALSQQYGFTIIEDASHAIGGRYGQKSIGACEHSHMTVFSFHPVKIVTSGEGGMVLTNSDALAAKLALLRSHGITRDDGLMIEADPAPWHYEQLDLGFNYRMTDIQAALGNSQMDRLDDFIAARHRLADRYDALLRDTPVITPVRNPAHLSGAHLYVIQLGAEVRKDRRAVFEAMRKAGVGVNVHYIPVHTQPYYQKLGFMPGMFPTSEAYYARAITLPLYPGLTNEQQDKVVSTLKQAIS